MPTAAEKGFFSSSKQSAVLYKTQVFISSKEMSTSKLINIKVAQQRTTSHRYAFERTYLMISYSIGTSSKLMLWIPSYASYRFGSFTIRNSLRSASSKNSRLKWHVIKYGLEWIGKTWTVFAWSLGLIIMRDRCVSGHVVREGFWGLDKLGEVRNFVSLGAELLEAGELSITFPRWWKTSSSRGEYSTEHFYSMHVFIVKLPLAFPFIYLIKLIWTLFHLKNYL